MFGRLRRASVLATGAALSAFALAALFQACATAPPTNLDDACRIFADRPAWRDATLAAQARWGVPSGTILAVIHQESRFRADARPGWRRALGVVPVGPRSSAFGYGQVKDGTWSDYRERADRPLARRTRFADVADFIGWYGDVIHRSAGVAKDDAFHLYLGYHEGPTGYTRRSFDAKPWLLGVARRVSERAERYSRQVASCGT